MRGDRLPRARGRRVHDTWLVLPRACQDPAGVGMTRRGAPRCRICTRGRPGACPAHVGGPHNDCGPPPLGDGRSPPRLWYNRAESPKRRPHGRTAPSPSVHPGGFYLARERQATTKRAFRARQIVPRRRAGRAHTLLAGNLARRLKAQLRDRPCEVYPSDMRVRIPTGELYTYPDVSVVCGAPQFEDCYLDTLRNPALLIAVLAPAPAAADPEALFGAYRAVASLQAYVLVAQDKVRVAHFARAGATWVRTVTADPAGSVALPALGATLALADVDRQVAFPDARAGRGAVGPAGGSRRAAGPARRLPQGPARTRAVPLGGWAARASPAFRSPTPDRAGTGVPRARIAAGPRWFPAGHAGGHVCPRVGGTWAGPAAARAGGDACGRRGTGGASWKRRPRCWPPSSTSCTTCASRT